MKLFKKLINYLALFIVLGTIGASAQTSILTLNTNSPYHAGDFTICLAPTISSPSLFAQGIKHTTLGYELQTEYFTTQTIGTSLIIGSRDYFSGDPYPIDHIAVLADYRYLPFPNNKFFNKFAFVLGTGAEQDVLAGSTGFLLKAGVDMDCDIMNWHFRPNLSVSQSFNTKSSINDTTISVSIQLFTF